MKNEIKIKVVAKLKNDLRDNKLDDIFKFIENINDNVLMNYLAKNEHYSDFVMKMKQKGANYYLV